MTKTTMLVGCPHACVNKLRVEVETDANGKVVSIEFKGHEHTHDEWTGHRLDRPTFHA